MTKMTKRDYFNRILSYAHEEDKEFILHELDLLAKKNSGERKPTATQEANEAIKEAIVEGLGTNAWTIGEICKGVGACTDLSSQKVSALVRQLVLEGKVVRTEEKRKAFFSVAQ
jgi:predicted Rossmann fold nucleotide-binding protein DprA/Smf involved in DNA uptake